MKSKVIIGVSSGIAAYKIIDLVSILRDKKLEVCIIMTRHAAKMFSISEFEKVSNHKVYTDLFPKGFDYKAVLNKREIDHVKVADSASLFVIAPATANIIGKIANGIADDFLTTTILATQAPILVFPSMNPHMWNNPIVQENIRKLRNQGFYIYTPSSGRLACGYEGEGRLPDIKIISEEIFKMLAFQDRLKGKKVIVTAGGTSEPIDAVRTITNRASGKMGAAIAEACFMQGADVLLLRAKTSIQSRFSIKEEIFETAKDLEDLIKKYVKNYDILFHTAAVSDFIPEKILDKKLESKKSFTLKLKSAPKILHQIKSWNPKIRLVGFKAVYKLPEKELIKVGMNKLKESKSDYIIVNDVGKEGVGFAVDTNEVYIISPNGLLAKIARAPKKEIARKILDYILFHPRPRVK